MATIKNKISEKNKKFVMMIEDVRSVRAVFMDEITTIQRDYDKEMKRIEQNYKSGSDAEKQAIEKATNSRDERKQAAKDEARKLVSKSIDEIEIINNAEIRAVSTNSIDKLKPLLDLPISRYEFEQLLENFGGSFWADKMLLSIAQKNGIEGDFDIMASMDDRKAVLDTIRGDFEKLIETYPGDDEAKIADKMILSDGVLLRLENEYTRGLATHSPDEKASRIITKALNQGNLLDRQLTLATELKNVPVDVQNRVVAKLVDMDVDDSIYNFIGGADKIKKIGKGENALIDSAKNKINEVISSDATDKGKAGFILEETLNNPYITDEMEKMARSNSAVGAVRDIIADAKMKDSRNGNTFEVDSLINQNKPRDIEAEKKRAATIEYQKNHKPKPYYTIV